MCKIYKDFRGFFPPQKIPCAHSEDVGDVGCLAYFLPFFKRGARACLSPANPIRMRAGALLFTENPLHNRAKQCSLCIHDARKE